MARKRSLVTFMLLLSTVAAIDDCNMNAKCVTLHDCKVLYTKLQQQGSNDKTIQLLRSLHCGFDSDNNPKICCPPELQVSYQPKFDPNSLIPDKNICGVGNYDRIVGGTQTAIDEHPWMALIRYDKPKGYGYYCGGVLISSRYVLTAAHCVKGADLPSNWKLSSVRLGEWNVTSQKDCQMQDCSPDVLDVAVEETITHQNYNPIDGQQQSDIALLRLDRSVKFTDFVKPICLPLDSKLRNNNFEGITMEVAGWGKTETKSNSDVKLKVRVPVVSNYECKEVYSRANRIITKSQLCAGGMSGEDSCKGDSGGPLMAQVDLFKNWMVIGVVSYGPSPCGTVGWPGVYTRVTSYTDWILSKVRP